MNVLRAGEVVRPEPDARHAAAKHADAIRVTDRAAAAALAWTTAYALVRVFWQLGHPPGPLSPIGTDLVVFTGWWAIALCAVAALTAVALMSLHPRGMAPRGMARLTLLTLAWVASAAFVAAGALLLVDVVAGILPGLGIPIFPAGVVSRAACVGAGVLLGRAALTYARRTGDGCRACGRTTAASGGRPPAWAFWAAYASVAGCLVRIGAQAWVGLDASPVGGGPTVLVFEIGFVLGGTLPPLALVHSWGRRWPFWLPLVSGRRVPRWLPLGPGLGVAGGLVAYFGVTFLQMVAERLQGRNPFPPAGGLDLPEPFFWVAVPAYLVWGLGLGAAALAYLGRSRPRCVACGG